MFDVLRQSVFRFLRETRGIAATEFALLLPIMVLLYAGAGELSQAAMTNRKVELLSRTLADVTSRQPTFPQAASTPVPPGAMTSDTLASIFNASLAIMAPAPSNSLQMTVSAVDIVNGSDGNCCVFKVRWSYTQSGTLRPCNVNLTPVPSTQAPSPTTASQDLLPIQYLQSLGLTSLPSPIPILIADVSYVYQGPFSSQWINFSGGMRRTSYMLPRTTGQVIVAGPLTATGNQTGMICY